jgi:hypothetical protein
VHALRPPLSGSQLIWPGLFERHGARLPYEFDMSTLAHISEGYAAGDLELVVRVRLRRGPAALVAVLKCA